MTFAILCGGLVRTSSFVGQSRRTAASRAGIQLCVSVICCAAYASSHKIRISRPSLLRLSKRTRISTAFFSLGGQGTTPHASHERDAIHAHALVLPPYLAHIQDHNRGLLENPRCAHHTLYHPQRAVQSHARHWRIGGCAPRNVYVI